MKTENVQALKKCLDLFERFAVSALGAGFFKRMDDPITVHLTLTEAKKALENESGASGGNDPGKGNPVVRNNMGNDQPKKERKKRSGAVAAGSGAGSENGSANGAGEIVDRNQPPLPFDESKAGA